MPGLFGFSGASSAASRRLEQDFRDIWPDCAVWSGEGCGVGAHAFGRPEALRVDRGGRCIAGDGEAALYAALAGAPGSAPAFRLTDGVVELLTPAVGNVAMLDGAWVYLAADWTGTVPLYYAEHEGGLLFSSHLRPLARSIGAEPDPVGLAQFLRFSYTIGARTQFRGIRRVLGGQSLRWHPAQGLQITEHSRLWAGVEPRFADTAAAADAAGAALDRSLRSLPGTDARFALMMSAGWDSRTVLASLGALGRRDRLHCYSHGDLASRELALSRRLCESAGTPWHAEPLDARLYELPQLRDGFARTECLLFPHWHRAGRLLADQGTAVALAGVFGEMLGGRYWVAHTESGVRKAITLFSTLLAGRHLPELPATEARTQARALFRLPALTRPWYAAPDALPHDEATLDAINADIVGEFDRYERRGVSTLNQLAEAFQGEHIGSRYCNVQLLSIRGRIDVGFPMADREVLEVATHTPLFARMQNTLNRRIVARRDAALLRLPMGATLAPASTPITVQELSRVVRKVAQTGQWSLHFATGGRVREPRLAWANYEFLREGTTLRGIIEGLRADVWDRPALLAWVERVERGQFPEQMLHSSEVLGRLMTIDGLLQ